MGHVLRNPVGAILNSAQLLLRMAVADKVSRLASIMQDSACRMWGLIDNMLDFAQRRLGRGLELNLLEDQPLDKILKHAADALSLITPGRAVLLHIDLEESVTCDGKRIAQVFSNLLSNAITYGNASEPVEVRVVCHIGKFTLSVTNAGDNIPESAMARLFQLFSLGTDRSSQKGLGLVLFISSETAAAHKGHLFAMSQGGKTCYVGNSLFTTRFVRQYFSLILETCGTAMVQLKVTISICPSTYSHICSFSLIFAHSIINTYA